MSREILKSQTIQHGKKISLALYDTKNKRYEKDKSKKLDCYKVKAIILKRTPTLTQVGRNLASLCYKIIPFTLY